MSYFVDELLEREFGRDAETVRSDQTGCYVGMGEPWISPSMIADLCDQAFRLGQRNPDEE